MMHNYFIIKKIFFFFPQATGKKYRENICHSQGYHVGILQQRYESAFF
jgi:hypothetical protein